MGRKPTLLPKIQMWLPWYPGMPQALGADSIQFPTGFLWDLLETKCMGPRSHSPQTPALQMARVTLGWALGSQGHFPEPGVCFSLAHPPLLCAPCLLERQALLWVSGQLKATPGEEGAGEQWIWREEQLRAGTCFPTAKREMFSLLVSSPRPL